MEKLTEVLTMDGYALYVWPSFLIASFMIAAMAIQSVRGLRRAQSTLARLQTLPETTEGQ